MRIHRSAFLSALLSVITLCPVFAQSANQSPDLDSSLFDSTQRLQTPSTAAPALQAGLPPPPIPAEPDAKRMTTESKFAVVEPTTPQVTRTTQQATTVAESKAEDNEPQTRERENPYANLPALRDLCRQLQASEQEPTRFGVEAFRNRRTGVNSDSKPSGGFPDDVTPDVPIDRDFVLGPGDGLTIDLWGGVSQRLSRTIDREGRIALPEAGTVVFAGKSLGDAQKLVEAVLARQFRNIHAELSLARLRSVRIYVVGEVSAPGAYDISSVSTALNALYAAGGPNTRGSMRRIRHHRGAKLLEEIDLYDFSCSVCARTRCASNPATHCKFHLPVRKLP